MAKRRKSKPKGAAGPSVYRVSMGSDYRGAGVATLTIPSGSGREARQLTVARDSPGEVLLWPEEIPQIESRGFSATPIKGSSSPNPTLTLDEAQSDDNTDPETDTDDDGGTD